MDKQLTKIWKSVVFTVLTIATVIIFSVVLTLNLRRVEELALKPNELETLKFVQVIFRHGERTPLLFLDVPNDPYRNFTYPPYGVSRLTNKGKEQMYIVGKRLRERYNQFLGDYYLPDLMKSTANELPRTQQSLQLVLAGLFPPKNELIWETGMNWQPIPYTITPKGHDRMFTGFFCPGFKQLYRELINNSETFQNYQNDKIFDYVSLHTGLTLTRPPQLYALYDILESQRIYGLSLPAWTDRVFPDELKKWYLMTPEIFMSTDRLKRLFVGYLFKHLLKEMYDKIDGKVNERLSLYSGHDTNIFGIGVILGFIDDSAIPFGASILVELHEIDDNYTLKFYYVDFQRPILEIEQQLRMEVKSIIIDEYAKLIEKYLPGDNECGEGPEGYPHLFDF